MRIVHLPYVHLYAKAWSAACSYGGVVERPNIAAAADWYIYKIQQLIDALE